MAKLNFGGLVQGAMGNAVEVSAEELSNEYSKYLFEGETIQNGFKLIRDVIIFTDIRIIFVDKQGASGKKTSSKSIYLSHIIDWKWKLPVPGWMTAKLLSPIWKMLIASAIMKSLVPRNLNSEKKWTLPRFTVF